jgi:hypothetical protein
LAKMESQTSRSLRPARAPHSKTVVAGKPITQQDRRSNPPINFSYSGKKDNVGHSGGASKATGKGPHMGPRLK